MALLTSGRQRAIPMPSVGMWPGLGVVPHVPIHAAIAKAVFRTAVRTLPISILFPDGKTWGLGGPTLELVRPKAFFSRIGRSGLIGFGEAWMTGDMTTADWHPHVAAGADPAAANAATDELAAVLRTLAGRMDKLVPEFLQKLRRTWQARQPAAEENTIGNSKANISRHYDLSNELFALFLDDTMTYSSAWFDSAQSLASDVDGAALEAAQLRKIDGVLDMAGVGPGMHILEIGSGWGALAIRAVAERGATVTTLTLSAEQKALAEARIAEAGLSDRIEVRLEDYRAHRGSYDAVVSVEMIEAVGEKYWPEYFSIIDSLLKPGGRVGLQAITIEHNRLLATRRGYTWVHKYVFPGGILPSLQAIDEVLAEHTTMAVVEGRKLGDSYAKTLRAWRHRFNDQLPQVRALGFDETFIRMWNFYLAYTEAGFAADYIDVWQLALARKP